MGTDTCRDIKSLELELKAFVSYPTIATQFYWTTLQRFDLLCQDLIAQACWCTPTHPPFGGTSVLGQPGLHIETQSQNSNKKISHMLMTKSLFMPLTHSLSTSYVNFLESSSRTSTLSQPLQVISNFLEAKSSSSMSKSASPPQAVRGNKPTGMTRNQSAGTPGNSEERAPQVPQVSVEAFSGLRLRSVAVLSL